MADKQTNLHPKNDSSLNLKPNIITGNIPDKAVTLEKLDQSIQDTLRSNTSSIATNRADINKNTAEIENLKASVNTGTFDPTSNNPAGQKSIMDAIIEADLNARFSRVTSGNLSGGFENLSPIYSGKFHLLRYTSFNWGSTFDFSFLFANTQVKEIDHSSSLSEVFERAGAINMNNGFQGSFVSIISATYSLRNVKSMRDAFNYSTGLKTIKLRDYPVSFDISSSTAFEESDLVEILNNLMDLTGKQSQTLTMGATNLAKLTDAEKAIATNKNWTLA